MSNKGPCYICRKEFTIKTLKKNNGICKKCFNSKKGVTKKNIPRLVKDKVWEVYVGNKFKTECYICEKEITATEFQAGHIESEYSGGGINIENLRPVCKKCNSCVGVFNMLELKKTLKVKKTNSDQVKQKKKHTVSTPPVLCIFCNSIVNKKSKERIKAYGVNIWRCETCSKKNTTKPSGCSDETTFWKVYKNGEYYKIISTIQKSLGVEPSRVFINGFFHRQTAIVDWCIHIC